MKMTVAACLTTLLFSLTLIKATVKTVVYQDSGLENLLFTDDVAFSIGQGVRSMVDCAGKCLADESCVGYTYGPGQCNYGYRVTVVANRGAASTSGLKTYRRTGESLTLLRKTCTDDGQCSGDHVECFKGECLCTPGAYYSNTSNGCVDNCAESDLSNTFVLKYPQSEYSGLDYLDDHLSLSFCQTVCLNDPSCRSFSYREAEGRCTASRYDVDDGFPSLGTYNPGNPDSDYYQKGCQ